MSQAPTRYSLVYVDDNRDDIDLMREALLESGYPIDLFGFTDVASALAAMAAMPTPDLVVSDFHMPLRNGLDLIESMRSSGLSTVPVVMVSGTTDGRQQGTQAGAVRHITKSVDWRGYQALIGLLFDELRRARSGD